MFLSDQEEVDAISKVLESKKLFRYQGPDIETECSKFEKEFSQYLNVPHSLLLSSGTNALVTALFINNIGEGDEVLIPAYTFFATVSAILEVGATPVIINVNQNLEIDLNEAKQKISNKTKALIAVHMDGNPCDMDSICAFVRENNLILIEDVAQAVGGSFNGKKLGSIGDSGCFSFNVDKIISCGEGGAIALNNFEKYQNALMYHDTCNQFGPTCKGIYTINSFSGKSMRASEIQGAMIRVQLRKIEKIKKNLRERKIILKNRLVELKFELLSDNENGECSTTIRIKSKTPTESKQTSIQLNETGFKALPVLMRPGHNVWEWGTILKKYGNYNRNQFLQSIDYLSCTSIIFVSLEESESEWIEKITKIKNLSII
jgi:8-amino-3,8-dideoxy-alpha-D-manno-octulosonate transaminase